MSIDVTEQTSPGFGALLRELRLRARLSQETLAERSRLSVGAISALERGARRAPYRSSVDLLADGLDLPTPERRRLHEAASRKRGPRGLGAELSYPPPPSSRGTLPTPLNGFHGRDVAVAALTELIRTRRLVTLYGAGGVGKTRLAVEVAARHADVFTDGVYFVDLAPVADGPHVIAAVGMALDVWERPGMAVLDDIAVALEGRSLMIVFDNCEHVLRAVAPAIARLLARCPRVHIVATSREPLRVDGEAILPVEALAVVSDDEASLSAAETLFFDRAADSGVALDPAGERAAVSSICRRLDGIPLAIELAASRIRALSPRQIDAALDQRFALLQDASPTRSARHRTLAGALDWSYDLLDDAEKALFRRLAVFPSSWTLEAAHAVCSAAPLAAASFFAVHASLVDRSLVSAIRSGETYRYQLGETVYQYAHRRLSDSGELDAVLASMIANAVSQLALWARACGGPGEVHALAMIDAEYPNLRATIAYAEQSEAHHESAHRLVQHLCDYWLIRGAVTEGLTTARRVLVAAMAGVPALLRARTALVLSRFLRLHHAIAEAEALDEATLATAIGSGDRDLEAQALIALAGDAFYSGRFEVAYRFDRDAAEILSETGDAEALGRTLHNLGAITTLLRRFDEADEYLVRSESILKRIDDRRGLGWVAFRRGFRSSAIGDLAASERYFVESLELRRVADDRSGLASSLVSLATVHTRRGNFREAALLLADCLQMSRTHGFTLRVVEASERLAHVAFLCGRTAQACDIMSQAQGLRQRLNAPMEHFDALALDDVLQAARERDSAGPVDVERHAARADTVEALAIAASLFAERFLKGDDEAS